MDFNLFCIKLFKYVFIFTFIFPAKKIVLFIESNLVVYQQIYSNFFEFPFNINKRGWCIFCIRLLNFSVHPWHLIFFFTFEFLSWMHFRLPHLFDRQLESRKANAFDVLHPSKHYFISFYNFWASCFSSYSLSKIKRRNLTQKIVHIKFEVLIETNFSNLILARLTFLLLRLSLLNFTQKQLFRRYSTVLWVSPQFLKLSISFRLLGMFVYWELCATRHLNVGLVKKFLPAKKVQRAIINTFMTLDLQLICMGRIQHDQLPKLIRC